MNTAEVAFVAPAEFRIDILTPQANNLTQASACCELKRNDPSDVVISFPTSRSWIMIVSSS
jgi:hypothetical protein